MCRLPLASLLLELLLPAARLASAEAAAFIRAINLNGPALTIDGRAWEAGATAPDFKTRIEDTGGETVSFTVKQSQDYLNGEFTRWAKVATPAMAIVRAVTENHGGVASLTSVLGEGTVAELRFPATEAALSSQSGT